MKSHSASLHTHGFVQPCGGVGYMVAVGLSVFEVPLPHKNHGVCHHIIQLP